MTYYLYYAIASPIFYLTKLMINCRYVQVWPIYNDKFGNPKIIILVSTSF